ncbi:hypothetical protein HF086_015609 [Spodoptera exigua]|uniref:Peptidase A2 domain-containing protein n=1 Tax=Spodoptera exigua TaxID=7107 RepID=A0A922MQY0_SPOEX|nr:hypothetical protein HF086_015609 [Spodoptera exigua]
MCRSTVEKEEVFSAKTRLEIKTMCDVLEQNYVLLVEIRSYLVKKGQSRYKEKNKDINLTATIELYERIKQKYEEINKLCIAPVTVELGKMDFDLKVACSLIPVMDGIEATTKRLIDSVEMYAGMLDEPEYSKFNRRFEEISFTQKSYMAIQTQLHNIQQGSKSIEDYGSEVEKLFTELTITQAEGKSDAFAILKPINESFAIKRFSDGLRSSKLSTIISARGFSSLKDAIQAAKDENCTSFQPTGNILHASEHGQGSHNIRRSQGFQRGTLRGQYINNYSRGHYNRNNNFNRGQGFRGNFRGNYRSSFNSQRGSRGSRYFRNRGRGRNVLSVEQVNDNKSHSDKKENLETPNQFFDLKHFILSCQGNAKYITFYIKNIKYYWLIDTGASLSIIKNEMLPKDVIVLKDNTLINGIGGQRRSQGSVNLLLKHGNATFQHNFLVFGSLPLSLKADGIIGLDFLEKFRANINIDSNLLTLTNNNKQHYLQFVDEHDKVKNALIIPARSESIHYIFVNDCINGEVVVCGREAQKKRMNELSERKSMSEDEKKVLNKSIDNWPDQPRVADILRKPRDSVEMSLIEGKN